MYMTWAEKLVALAEQVNKWVSDDLAKRGVVFVAHEVDESPEADKPFLEISIGGWNVLRLEPAGFAVDRDPTIVHLYAYPTLRRVRLVGPDDAGNWEVQTSEGVPVNYEWNKVDFMKLLRALSDDHAARSV